MSRWAKLRLGMVCCLILMARPVCVLPQATATTKHKAPAKSKPAAGKAAPGKASGSKSAKGKSAKGRRTKSTARNSKGKQAGKKHRFNAQPTARSIRLTTAFTASANLRPMAQQLAASRSPAAYAGVQNYAAAHPGEPASAAYLALGHAFVLDHHYPDAVGMFRRAASAGQALDDYADYLGAQASLQANHPADAYALLDHFADRHPDSIFIATAPILLANAHLQSSDASGALHVLEPLEGTPIAAHADFRYTLGRAYQLSGNTTQAAQVYRKLYAELPLSFEATQSRSQLQAMGTPLSPAERKSHADQLFNAKRYTDAGEEYHEIAQNSSKSISGLSEANLDALKIYEAVCDLKLKHLSRRDVERLPDTGDDSAALKLYMLAEISRNEDDRSGHDAIVAQMVKRFPTSRWLEEALYSGGNMYLIKHENQQAIYHYTTLVTLFPNSTYAPSAHWHAAWLNYRIRNYAEAARLMDEQIERYAGGIEVPSALYWRGRIFEDEDRNFAQAVNYYQALSTTYINYYYAHPCSSTPEGSRLYGCPANSRPHLLRHWQTSIRLMSPSLPPSCLKMTFTSSRRGFLPTPHSMNTSALRSRPAPTQPSGARSPRLKSTSPTASTLAPCNR